MSIADSTPPDNYEDPDKDLDDPREYDEDEDGNFEPWYPGYQEDEDEDDYEDEDDDDPDDIEEELDDLLGIGIGDEEEDDL